MYYFFFFNIAGSLGFFNTSWSHFKVLAKLTLTKNQIIKLFFIFLEGHSIALNKIQN